MHPCGGEYRADRLRDHGDVFDRKSISRSDFAHHAVDVADGCGKGWRIAALAGRAAVASRIPGVEGVIRHCEFVDQMSHAAAMFMAAMEENDGTLGVAGGGGPVAVEQFGPIMGLEGAFDRRSRTRYREFRGGGDMLKHHRSR
jgi:hypothetical protein